MALGAWGRGCCKRRVSVRTDATSPAVLAVDQGKSLTSSRAYEVIPNPEGGPLTVHQVFLAGWGLPIGEMVRSRPWVW